MMRYGSEPYLECSSRGDKRFSAFYARPTMLGGKSIEEAYQAAKRFEDGSTGLGWREAKGRKAANQEEVVQLYERAWVAWITEQRLLPVLQAAAGLSDRFGSAPPSVCQAEVLWRIRNGELR